MPGTTTPSATARAPSIITNLLAELGHADHIIKTTFNVMTKQQQARVGAQLEAAGVASDGITRHHERAAAIAAAEAEEVATPAVVSKPSARRHLLDKPSARRHLLDIEALASDIDVQGEHIEILLGALLEKLDDLSQAGDESVVAVINCFATCALRNAALMREAGEQIFEHVEAGMAA